MDSVLAGQQRAMDSVVDRFTEFHDRTGSEDYTSDKFQAISGLEFKRSPPTIRDDDPDLDRHDREFDNLVACYSFGSRRPREVDKLHMYATSSKEGSTRRMVYENALRRAIREGRIPAEAKEVLAEIRKELRTYIWETPMQKMTR